MPEEKRTILLIEPPFNRLFKNTYSLDRYPLALGYLAGVILRDTGWEARTYNADFHPRGEWIKVSYLAGAGYDSFRENLRDTNAAIWSEIRRVLEDVRPTVVGLSVKTQTCESARIIARLAKRVDPSVRVVVGGPHPSILGEKILDDCPEFDLAVIGEGEDTIIELLHAIETGSDPAGVAGIAYRRDGRPVRTAGRPLREDLDALAFPHANAPRTLLGREGYPPTAFRNVFAVRGCPYDCFFCGSRNVWTRRVRFRSPDNVADELAALQTLGLRYVHFDDDTFGVRPEYIHDLCRTIRRRCPRLRWSCELHVRLAQDDILAAMRQAGCYMIQLGVESGSDEILAAMRKGFTIAEARDACRRIVRTGIWLQTFFMVGFPQETEQTLAETIRAMREIPSHRVNYSIFTPYPGTEAYAFCQANGLIDASAGPSAYFHQNPRNCFCLSLTPERFRRLVGQVERTVDRRNAIQRVKEVFSPHALRRAGELGLRGALQKGWRVIRGR